MRCRRCVEAGVAALLLTAAACSTTAGGERGERRERESVSVGSEEDLEAIGGSTTTVVAAPTTGVVPAPSSGATAPAAADGEEAPSGFAVTITDAEGRPRVGVPVQVAGRSQNVVVSDAAGVARHLGRPGRYELRIDPHCGADVQVQTGASAQIAVPEGSVVEGRLQVESRRRFGPAAPTSYRPERSVDGSDRFGRQWPSQFVHIVSFEIEDRCTGSAAPGADFTNFVFTGPPELRIQAQSQRRADAEGKGHLRVTCTGQTDDIELFATDRTDAGDRVDLFSRAMLDDNPPSCTG
ncbi:MAG TPA: hypothetical protein VM933_07295 [Acidimicrobiales bacterium]|nr:hypothetical protein [Acidimicrobiales bacterium]